MKMIRYIKIILLFALFWVLSWFFWVQAYLIRDFVRANTNKLYFKFLWLFLNDTTKQSENDIDYGDYGRFKHNIIGAFRQNLRNNAWNFKINYTVPEQGEKTHYKGNTLLFYNTRLPIILGKQYATYKINGVSYFRLSATLKIPFWFFGYKYYNYMLGASNTRYLFKIRLK